MPNKHPHKKLVFAEILVVVASVLIWRSLWHLLDRLTFTNQPGALVVSLVAGFMILIPSLKYIIDRDH